MAAKAALRRLDAELAALDANLRNDKNRLIEPLDEDLAAVLQSMAQAPRHPFSVVGADLTAGLVGAAVARWNYPRTWFPATLPYDKYQAILGDNNPYQIDMASYVVEEALALRKQFRRWRAASPRDDPRRWFFLLNFGFLGQAPAGKPETSLGSTHFVLLVYYRGRWYTVDGLLNSVYTQLAPLLVYALTTDDPWETQATPAPPPAWATDALRVEEVPVFQQFSRQCAHYVVSGALGFLEETEPRAIVTSLRNMTQRLHKTRYREQLVIRRSVLTGIVPPPAPRPPTPVALTPPQTAHALLALPRTPSDALWAQVEKYYMDQALPVPAGPREQVLAQTVLRLLLELDTKPEAAEQFLQAARGGGAPAPVRPGTSQRCAVCASRAVTHLVQSSWTPPAFRFFCAEHGHDAPPGILV